MQSCVLIITADLQAKANTISEIMGWGPNSYTVPLSSTGQEPATHYGLHAWVEQSFVDMMLAAQNTNLMPQPLVDAGMSPSDFTAVISALIASFRPDIGSHWDDVLIANGLQRITPSDDASG